MPLQPVYIVRLCCTKTSSADNSVTYGQYRYNPNEKTPQRLRYLLKMPYYRSIGRVHVTLQILRSAILEYDWSTHRASTLDESRQLAFIFTVYRTLYRLVW